MIFHSPDTLLHQVSMEFDGQQMRNYPEQPERIEMIVSALSNQQIPISIPDTFSNKWIKEMHTSDYVDFILSLPSDLQAIAPISINTSGAIRDSSSFYAKLGYYFYDPATPIMGKTAEAALAAINCSISMAKTLTKKYYAFALCRPPGHHAMKSKGGGYCIFNNVAVAANYLTTKGNSVSIIDLDYHHGNGTQTLFYERDDVQYSSIHADNHSNYPFYWGYEDETGSGPGTGLTNNYPVPNTTSEKEYLHIMTELMNDVSEYQPDIVLVSMGFDCHVDDPIAGMGLTSESYYKIGELLSQYDHVGVVLEGGYDLKSIGQNFLQLYQGLTQEK